MDHVKRRLHPELIWKVEPPPEINRQVMTVFFANKLIEEINLQHILHNSQLAQHIPKNFTYQDPPIVAYKYTLPIRNKVLNYQETVTKCKVTTIDEMTCSCHNFKGTKHFNKDRNHVITGHLDFVEHPILQELLEKGPNFRDATQLNFEEAEKCIDSAIFSHIKKWADKERVNLPLIMPWVDHVKKLVQNRIEDLKKHDHPSVKPQLNSNTKHILKKLHKDYVLTLVDKASGNIAIMCKTHYLKTMKKEFDSSATYNEITHLADEKQDLIIKYCKKHGIGITKEQIKFPYPYICLKAHKNPVGNRFVCASAICSTKNLSQLITVLLKKLLSQRRNYCKIIQETRGINAMWIIDNTSPFLSMLDNLSSKQKAKTINTFDFSTLYTKIPHKDLKEKIKEFIESCYKGANGNKYLSIRKNSLGLKNARVYWTKKLPPPSKDSKKVLYISCDTFVSHINMLIGNIYVMFGDKLFQQNIGIPMGTDCAPLLANIYLHMYEYHFMIKMQRTNIKEVRKFNNTMRYIDDLSALNNPIFEKYKSTIYPESLILNPENKSSLKATFLDTNIEINSDCTINISIYDKRDDFPFEINTYPYPQSNISTKNAIKVYISQLVRISRICNNVENFHSRNCIIAKKLMEHGFTKENLIKTFKQFAQSHEHELLKYNYSPRQNGMYIKRLFDY